MSRGDPRHGQPVRRPAARRRFGADVTPRPVQTARVTMSRIPTCNRIFADGGWDIPPDYPSLARLLANVPGTNA